MTRAYYNGHYVFSGSQEEEEETVCCECLRTYLPFQLIECPTCDVEVCEDCLHYCKESFGKYRNTEKLNICHRSYCDKDKGPNRFFCSFWCYNDIKEEDRHKYSYSNSYKKKRRNK